MTAGAVVPTPADCQPEKKWCQVVDHEGNGASWPTSGSEPKNSSRVPTTITSSATSTATQRAGVPCSAERGADPPAEAVTAGATAQVVEVVEVGVLAERRPHAAGQDRHLGALVVAARPVRVTATELAASMPWWESRLR